MDQKQSLVSKDIEAAIARLVAGQRGSIMSAEQCAAVVALLMDGATLTSICRREGMPRLADVYATCAAVPAFAADLDHARRIQATSRLDRAQDVLDAALDGGDIDDIRGAAVYAEQTTKYAEKIAPKEYGQLVKLADATGAVNVTVVDYASGKFIGRGKASPARLAEATDGEGEAQSSLGAVPADTARD